ncbi:stealth family protein [Actinacidiphila glaucinigra]|uniref:Stealth protein CR4, conserved region 4 n=1 Tax=Actinacidiphila glaucinigra TaxID=235986 RepID=A0A239C186_9ACTN|nr:stealth family protein [Actinacidiphila glaucinigra]SNS14075.1 Stealth protein CR4, conserved region 4 [Actinacidiphila glaucinigra]
MSTGNPEASAAVGLYRTIVPTALRRRIARHVPIRLRMALKQLLRSLQSFGAGGRMVRGAVARRRWPQLFRGDERLAVLTGGGRRIALVRPTTSPLGLREANLELVVTLLEEGGVDYFAIRGNSDFRSCVAVSEADRGRLRQILQEVALKEPLYLVACQGDKARGGVAACGSRRARRITRDASVLRVGMLWSDPGSSLTLGLEHGCDIEFWRPQEGRLVAPRPNRVTQDVALDEPRIAVPVSRLTGFAALHTRRTRSVRTIAPCAQPLPEDVRFPIDVVYTWVDGSDPMWQRRRSAYEGGGYHVESANAARYISRDELRYSMRALQQNAPWVRNVYVVTDRQRPGWLNDSHPRITVVDHSEIFDDPSALPTFNSHAIESRLHHIEGLSEHFLYFNDDMFLGCPVTPQTFFLSNGMTRTFLSPSQLPGWELTLGDRPVDAAGKNNRRLILDNFGSAIVQKMRHAPYALRRSVLHEIEREFAEAHWGTSHSRFRSPTDISIPSSLYHYYAYFTGRAVPSEISFAYLDLARPEIQRRLGILLARRDRQAFCINDTLSDGMDVARQTAMLRGFLDAYYPVPSPFEHKEREVR